MSVARTEISLFWLFTTFIKALRLKTKNLAGASAQLISKARSRPKKASLRNTDYDHYLYDKRFQLR